MAMMAGSRNTAVRRLVQELKELNSNPDPMFTATYVEDNLFDWHFTIRGASDSDFEGGIYHGRIVLPADYPFKPPDIYFFTPNGRFETNTKICLSISGFHPKTWQPSWGIRTIITATIAFMMTPGEGAVGALDWPKAERQRLAAQSLDYCCSICAKKNSEILTPLTPEQLAAETKASSAAIAAIISSASKAASSSSPSSPASTASHASPALPSTHGSILNSAVAVETPSVVATGIPTESSIPGNLTSTQTIESQTNSASPSAMLGTPKVDVQNDDNYALKASDVSLKPKSSDTLEHHENAIKENINSTFSVFGTKHLMESPEKSVPCAELSPAPSPIALPFPGREEGVEPLSGFHASPSQQIPSSSSLSSKLYSEQLSTPNKNPIMPISSSLSSSMYPSANSNESLSNSKATATPDFSMLRPAMKQLSSFYSTPTQRIDVEREQKVDGISPEHLVRKDSEFIGKQVSGEHPSPDHSSPVLPKPISTSELLARRLSALNRTPSVSSVTPSYEATTLIGDNSQELYRRAQSTPEVKTNVLQNHEVSVFEQGKLVTAKEALQVLNESSNSNNAGAVEQGAKKAEIGPPSIPSSSDSETVVSSSTSTSTVTTTRTTEGDAKSSTSTTPTPLISTRAHSISIVVVFCMLVFMLIRKWNRRGFTGSFDSI